jgi:1,4-alpha-glucan branching enzyme
MAQVAEWNHDGSIEWHLEGIPAHQGIERLLAHLNRTYAGERALHERDVDAGGFEWLDADDAERSLLSFARRARDERDQVVIACNFTPVPRHGYRLGVHFAGRWREIVNTDAAEYGGSGQGNMGMVETTAEPWYGRPCSLVVTVPPLGAIFLKRENG